MIFEREYFNNYRASDSFINESLREIQKFSTDSQRPYEPTVFISHKHEDLNDLRGVIGLLQRFGVKIYIDSMDNKMPEQTSGETAKRIKEVIRFCDKFILLATNKAIESFWCNWELGLGDTTTYISRIAILPVKEKGTPNSDYKGNEYLRIYPQIDYEDGKSQYRVSNKLIPQGYYVCEPTNKEGIRYITPLKDWLNKNY